MQNFAIKEGQKITLNINMGDGKKIGQGSFNKPGGGLKALKKPLAPLSKPSGSSNNNNMMGFGMGGGATSAQDNSNTKEEIDLLGVQNDAVPSNNDGPTDLLSAMSSGPSQQAPAQDLFSQLPSYPDQQNQNSGSFDPMAMAFNGGSAGSAGLGDFGMNGGATTQAQPPANTGFVPGPMDFNANAGFSSGGSSSYSMGGNPTSMTKASE